MPHLCGCCEGAVDSVISVLHSCIGQASTKTLRPCMSQCDSWLLIFGREKAKQMVAAERAFPFFSSNAKMRQISKEKAFALC